LTVEKHGARTGGALVEREDVLILHLCLLHVL
jgi:hypothetical protein